MTNIPENWTYEDQLPEMTDTEYSEWYSKSDIVDGVRMGPKFIKGGTGV